MLFLEIKQFSNALAPKIKYSIKKSKANQTDKHFGHHSSSGHIKTLETQKIQL